jgi:hypothetical protein
MYWAHIDFFFKKNINNYLSEDEQFAFEDLLRKIIRRIKPFIRRKFYLYEPQPNCFLAIELRSKIFIPIVYLLVKGLHRDYWFIKHFSLHSVSGKDETNGEGFLDVLNAMTNYYLFKNDAKLTHIIHCCLEFQKQIRVKELLFYYEMLEEYGQGIKEEKKCLKKSA